MSTKLLQQLAQPHIDTITTAEHAIPALRAAHAHSKAHQLPGTSTLKWAIAQAEQAEFLARRHLDELVRVDHARRSAAALRQTEAALAGAPELTEAAKAAQAEWDREALVKRHIRTRAANLPWWNARRAA